MRPLKFEKFVPQVDDLRSNKTVWKILNRTIYRNDDPAWLRNQTFIKPYEVKNISQQEREAIKKLMTVYGIKHLYPDELFYKTHKISRLDFFEKLEQA